MRIGPVVLSSVLALAAWVPAIFAACCERPRQTAHDCCNRTEGCATAPTAAPVQWLPAVIAAIQPAPAAHLGAAPGRSAVRLAHAPVTARHMRDSYLKNRVLLI